MKLIKLTRGMSAIVDEEDFECLSKLRWFFKHGYAMRNRSISETGASQLFMHRIIIGAVDGVFVDHINGNKLDNRRANLRLSNKSQNEWNKRVRRDSKIGLKGVSLHKQSQKFRARIKVFGKTKSLGLFHTPEEAHVAYCMAAKRLHGEFARFN